MAEYSNEELLKNAEAGLEASFEATDMELARMFCDRSIASSLLVLARNSQPTIEDRDVSKDKWIEDKLKEYDKYWKPEQRIYAIPTGDDEDFWTPTRDELKKDLDNAWEFEKEGE